MLSGCFRSKLHCSSAEVRKTRGWNLKPQRHAILLNPSRLCSTMVPKMKENFYSTGPGTSDWSGSSSSRRT